MLTTEIRPRLDIPENGRSKQSYNEVFNNFLDVLYVKCLQDRNKAEVGSRETEKLWRSLRRDPIVLVFERQHLPVRTCKI